VIAFDVWQAQLKQGRTYVGVLELNGCFSPAIQLTEQSAAMGARVHRLAAQLRQQHGQVVSHGSG
jgi:hypothetical protein